jgi:pimeloyl-ACP methyl ester carboxylesterase
VKEQAIRFGPDSILSGVFCRPDGEPDPSRPALLFWNVGLLHRVGPFRMYVDLARRLAAQGFASLRFDLSGLGDSLPARDQAPRHERVTAEIRSAMDWVANEYGSRTFTLVGLCSGADDAHAVTAADERVTAAVLIDGYTYPTLRFHLLRHASFLSSPRRIGRFFKRCWVRLRRIVRREPAEPSMADELGLVCPPRAAAQRDIQNLVDRGGRLLFVYTGEAHAYYNYAAQFWDMFPGLNPRGRIACDYMREADHIFSEVPARRALMDRICAWITNPPAKS